MKISHIEARQILDSRGNPTVEADVWLENGSFGRAAVPSGASTGSHEAHELRDGGHAYGGLGVTKAISNIQNEISNFLRGIPADDQFLIDDKLITFDATPNKSRLGANAILAVSLACAHAAAKARGVLLYEHINDIAQRPEKSIPLPMMNVLNGGKHASNSSDFQEFMIIPINVITYYQAVQIGAEIFQTLKKIIAESGNPTTVGDEGGFTYPISVNHQMLDLLVKASEAAGYQAGKDIVFGLDIAASELYQAQTYHLQRENRTLQANEMINYLKQLCNDYPILSIEDGLEQDQWDDWTRLTHELHDLQIVGDDLLVTNTTRLQQAIDKKAANSILIKPNQIGTLTETIATIRLAQQHGWKTIVSHRSGETEDVTIAHLAVGTGAGQIKTGSLSRSERTAKHNELMRIESIDPTLQLAQPFSS